MNGDKRRGSIRSRMQDYRRRMSWDEYLKNLDVEMAELHPAVKKDDNYEKGYCDGFIKAWNTQAEIKERTCHLEQHGSLANWPEMVCWSCSECHFGWHHDINDKQFSYCPNCGAKVVEE